MYKFIFLLLFIMSFDAFSYVDLNLSYSFSRRRIEGVDNNGDTDPSLGEAIVESKGYRVNWAWYIWDYTAIEFNYADRAERLLDDREVVDSESGITIKEVDSITRSLVYGVGIRQSFASRKAAIIPSISIGFAKLVTSGKTEYTFEQSGTEYVSTNKREKVESNSSYATVELAFRLTQLARITFGAKSVMENFEIEDADKNVTYSAGLSWMF